MIQIPSIVFGDIGSLKFLPLLVIVYGLIIYRAVKQRRAYKQLAGNNHRLLSHYSFKKQLLKVVLLCIASFFLFIALVRPQWNALEENIVQEGRDLYIGLDISRSMLAVDCLPNRLVCAKNKIKYMLKKLSCERVGLILFSGSAFVQCPLTSDYSAFYVYLDSVDAELISSGSTAIDQAIKCALSSFENTAERKNKLLVLFTDGEDFSHNLSGITQQAVEKKLSIFTLGIGTTEGAPVPLFDPYGNKIGHQKDKSGNVVISRLNENILHSLSHSVGGQYIRYTENYDDIDAFVKVISERDKEAIGEQKISRFEDQYHYILVVSFILFILEWLL
jgi:Ca-activated chloride channel family protein